MNDRLRPNTGHTTPLTFEEQVAAYTPGFHFRGLLAPAVQGVRFPKPPRAVARRQIALMRSGR